MKYKQNCPLCKLKHKTKWYYADTNWIILNCDTCEGGDKVPMIVYKQHKTFTEIPSREIAYIIEEARSIFGQDIKFRKEQRKATQHFHWYILVKGKPEYHNN